LNRKTDAFKRLKSTEGFRDILYRYLAAFQVVSLLFKTLAGQERPAGKI
jgi:hypothetical protein